MAERDEESGQYTDAYPEEAFLEAIRDAHGMVGTGEIADAVGCAHDTAYKRLQTMEGEGVVRSQKVGNTLVWRLTDA